MGPRRQSQLYKTSPHLLHLGRPQETRTAGTGPALPIPTPGLLGLVEPLITAHWTPLFLLHSTLVKQVPCCMAQDVGAKEVKLP